MKSYKSVEAMLEDIEIEKKKHPIKTFYFNVYYFFFHLFEIPGNIYREIKWFIQRGQRGYSDRDIWNLDYYLAELISKSVLNLKNNHQGYPESKIIKTDEDWNEVLDKITYTFSTLKTIGDGDRIWTPLSKCSDEKLKRFNPISKEEHIKINAGWKLFQRHFLNLWD